MSTYNVPIFLSYFFQFVEIALMYTLFARVPSGHTCMKSKMASVIQASGLALHMQFGGYSPTPNDTSNLNTMDAVKWTESILSLKSTYDRILSDALQGDKSFQITLNEVRILIEM